MGATPAEVVVPHANWRGVYGKGTTASGTTSTIPVEWPGFKTTAYHRMAPSQQPTTNWMGSLIGGQRDPGGTLYMRNRYYDPQTGQFTQKDPIGIRGGLNTYGFAGGDPASNWDPFGTCYFRIGPDYAFGRCGEDQQYYDSPQQERGPCARNSDGGCITYIPSVEQWNRLGNAFRRIPTHTDYCAGTRSHLLELWNMGRQSGRIKFWDGYDVLILRGKRQQIRGDHAWSGITGSWITYDSWLVFDEGSVAPHEGLHGYFHRVGPPPRVTDLETYIHDIDGNCSWK